MALRDFLSSFSFSIILSLRPHPGRPKSFSHYGFSAPTQLPQRGPKLLSMGHFGKNEGQLSDRQAPRPLHSLLTQCLKRGGLSQTIHNGTISLAHCAAEGAACGLSASPMAVRTTVSPSDGQALRFKLPLTSDTGPGPSLSHGSSLSLSLVQGS